MEENGNEEEWEEDNIIECCHFFSNIPLGLAVGVAALHNTRKSIKVYLDTLKKSGLSQRMRLIEAGESALGTYDVNVITALMNTIVDCRFGNADEPMAKVMECAVYMDTKNLSGKMLKAIALHIDPKFSEAEGEVIVGDLIYEMNKTSLGETTGRDKSTNVCIHECVKFAWIQTLSQADTFHNALEFLNGHSSKDNRFLADYRSSVDHMSHINEALDHRDWSQGNQEINFKTKVLAIQLYDVLGHLYCQNQEPLLGKFCMERALELFYAHILKASEKTIEEKVRKDNGSKDLRETDRIAKIAEFMYEKLQDTEIEDVAFLAEQEIVNRKISKRDQEDLKTIIPDLNQECDFAQSNGFLDTSWLNYLQDMNVLLPVEVQSKIFLIEGLMSILYTYGRVYFYLKDRIGVSLEERRGYEKSLQLAQQLGKLVNDRMKVHLMQYNLILRQGVMQMKLEAQGKTKQQMKEDYLHASMGYTALSKTSEKCYKLGMLKSCLAKDTFHQMQCMKQKCCCIIRLIDLSEVEMPSEDLDRELPEIKAMETMLEENPNFKLNAVNLADFYNELGRVYLKLTTRGYGDVYGNEAYSLYTKAFESAYDVFAKKLNEFRFNHIVIDAIIGLVNVVEAYHDEQRLVHVHDKLNKFQKMIKATKFGSKSDFSKEDKVAADFKKRLEAMNEID